MSLKFKYTSGLLGLFLFCTSLASAQTSASSYSAIGIGDFNYYGSTHNAAMGGLGVSNGNVLFFNTVNPALVAKHNIGIFQAGVNYENRSLSNGTLEQPVDGGGLTYLGLGLPMKPGKWSIALGLNPVTTVNYNLSIPAEQIGGTEFSAENNIKGTGGMTEAYVTNAFRIKDNFYIGLKMSYLFGSIIEQNIQTIVDDNSFPVGNQTEYYDRQSFSDFSAQLGVAYNYKLKDQLFLNFGAAYQFDADINTRRFLSVGLLDNQNSGVPIGDTLINDRQNFVSLPGRSSFGISIEKSFNWTFGVDVHLRDMTSYRGFDGVTENFDNAYSVIVGGEFTPDYTSSESRLKTWIYRFGVSYDKTPYLIGSQQINDVGINFGVSVPVRQISMLNVALKAGQRGTLDNGAIRENYFRVALGVTINDTSWFIKRKFD